MSGKCSRSIKPASNGLTTLQNLDGGVGVWTIGNKLSVSLRVRIERGVQNLLEFADEFGNN